MGSATVRTEAGSTRLWFAVASAFVLAVGWLEGWYGKTVAGDVYGSDAVQYLDIARALGRGDWHSALNPIWSQGYPALLALVRPMFRAGVDGEWNAIRTLNFAIFAFSWLCFAGLVRELRVRSVVTLAGALGLFVTAQVAMDQVSRVGPDQMVAAIFFVVCALLLRMRREPGVGVSIALGLALGLGFLVKAIFLPLGVAALVIVGVALVRERQPLRWIAPAVVVFGVMVAGYGVALSRATGAPTLGEAGSLNYAWHVDRLAKWVHWEGGVDPADKAWPKPWIARFTHWESDPPDFGRPVHPSEVVGSAPAMYVFHAPVRATYVPYFDPPYWYQGYRRVVRWRYQVVALGKNAGDLALIVVKQPPFWAVALAWLFLLRRREARKVMLSEAPAWIRGVWPGLALALAGVAIYVPVHLEGRYIAAFLAVYVLVMLDGFSALLERSRFERTVVLGLLALGFAAGLVKDQREVWSRAVHGWSVHDNVEWREGAALARERLPVDAEVGVISWTPNVQCDWAYLGGVRITSEIAAAADEHAFWALTAEGQAKVLRRFQQAGAVAVVTRDQPKLGAVGWRQLGALPMWIYRF